MAVSVSIRIPQDTRKAMKSLWQSKYGGKGKSLWANEAIETFIDQLNNQHIDFNEPQNEQVIDVLEWLSDIGSIRGASTEGVKEYPDRILVEDDVYESLSLISQKIDDFCRFSNYGVMRINFNTRDSQSMLIRAAIEQHITACQIQQGRGLDHVSDV